MFDTLTESFTSAIKKIRFHDDEKSLIKATAELKKALLKADVNYKVVKELIFDVELRTKAKGIGKDQFLDALRETLYAILEVGGKKGFVFAPNPPTVILMTGLQGSGKTTTIYSALAELNKADVNISTAEDPIEFNLEGINQVQMNPDIELNFSSALRAFLRQDPDIIMVGEIRDGETAGLAVNASLTGHLVL